MKAPNGAPSKWGGANKQDLAEVLTPEELIILNSNVGDLYDRINKFNKHWEAKIENNKLKIKISDGRNVSKHLVMMKAVNELRSILDEYSLLIFDKFGDAAKGFTEDKFDTIIDEVLDDPSGVILNEKHIPKPDNVRCEIVWDDNTWVVKILGPNKEVRSTYRLLYGFCRLVKHRKIEGTLSKDFDFRETINRNLKEDQWLWLSVRHFPEEQLTYISYVENKIEDNQLSEIEGLIKSQTEVKQAKSNQYSNNEESKLDKEKLKSIKKEPSTQASLRKSQKDGAQELFKKAGKGDDYDTHMMISDSDSSDG